MTFVVAILSALVGLLVGRYVLAKPIIVMGSVELSDEDYVKIKDDLAQGGVVQLPSIFKKKKRGARAKKVVDYMDMSQVKKKK
mgnify:CR=1 FL=1